MLNVTPMNETLNLAKQLICRESISPHDGGCQEIIANYLKQHNFTVEKLNYADVNNLWATHGTGKPLVVFAGHTDVVPPGPIDKWDSDPFIPEIRDGYLYGRGAADMKTAVAAMTVAAARFCQQNPKHKGTIALLITSCEEETTANGTEQVINTLSKQGVKIDYAIVGEASSQQRLGDQIKNGRRGSLHGNLTIYGKQGHVAYPHLADNPIHRALTALDEITHINWNDSNDFFPATTMQISNFHAGTGATNIIPGQLELLFNLRYSPASSVKQITANIEKVLQEHHLNYHIHWDNSSQPFLTQPGRLISATQEAIYQVTGINTVLSTSGGTSDARFIAATDTEVVEIGFCNDTIHQVNERVNLHDIDQLTAIYQTLLLSLVRH